MWLAGFLLILDFFIDNNPLICGNLIEGWANNIEIIKDQVC